MVLHILASATTGGVLPSLFWVVLGLLIAGTVALVACWIRANRRARALLSLTDLSQSISRARWDPLSIYRAVSEHIEKITDAPTLILHLRLSPDSTDYTVISNGKAVVESEQLPTLGQGPIAWLEEHRTPLEISEFDQDTPVEPFTIDQAAKSALYVPLLADDRLLGAISLQSPRKRAFGPRVRSALQLAAHQVAMGLHTAIMYRQEQDRSAQLLMIAEVSRKVAAIMDLDTLFRDTVRLVQETFGYYHVSIFSIDTESRQIRLQASSSQLIEQRGLNVPWGKGLIGHAAIGRQTILANDVREDPRFLADATLERTAAELALPLIVEDRVLGVLDLQSDRVAGFQEQDISILGILADQIAVAVEDSRIYRAQQEQAWISTALLQVAEAVAEESTLEDVTGTVSRLAKLLTGVERCQVLVWSVEDEVFFLPESTNGSGTALSAAQHFRPEQAPLLEQLRIDTTSVLGTAEELGTLASVLLPDANPDASVLGLPLSTKGELIGSLIVQAPRNGRLPPAQRTVLEGIARQASLGLENATLLASQREEAWVSTALLQVANVIAGGSYDLSETATTIVRLTPMLVGVSWCAILVWDAQADLHTGVSSYGLKVELQDRNIVPLYTAEEIPWLIDVQASDSATTMNRDQLHELGLTPNDDSEGETLILPLRAHQQDLGLLVVGPSQISPRIRGRRLAILNGIAGQTALAVSATRLYQQSVRQERLEHEMRLARDIQTSFLPDRSPQIPGWQIAVDWRAARGVGGDYYDFIELGPGKLGVAIADVSDKGVAAALYMALSRTVLRAAALDLAAVGNLDGPGETLRRSNRVLLQESSSGMFVSMVYGIIDLEKGTLRYVRAGHNPPLLLRAADGQVRLLDPPGIVLGIIAEPSFEQETLELAPGDTLVMYTDGVTEAWNDSDEEFGMERLLRVVSDAAGMSPDAIVARIREAVQEFAGHTPLGDDYTVVVIQREGMENREEAAPS